jgi:dipeptidyl aminopeptidase/acylaminoacyl peptidase
MSCSLAYAGTNDRRLLTVADLDNLTEVSDPQISPEGDWVAYTATNATKTTDQYLSTLRMVSWDGKQQVALTQGPNSASKPRWSPDGRFISFLSSPADEGADAQVWILDRRGGDSRQLTHVPGDVADYAWSPDSSRLALVATLSDEREATGKAADSERPPKPIVIDRYQFKNDDQGYVSGMARPLIYLYEIDTGKLDALTGEDTYDESAPAWSPDGSMIAFSSNRDIDADRTANTDIFVAKTKPRAELHRLTTYDGQDIGPLAWSADGRWLAYVQGPEPKYWLYEFGQVAIVPTSGGTPEFPTGFLNRDTSHPRFSQDGSSLELIVTDDRSRYLASVPLKGGSIDRLTSTSEVTSEHSRSRQNVAVLSSRPHAPAEIYALEGDEPRQLTRHNDAWLASVKLGPVEGVTFGSTDGEVDLGALITRPPFFKKGRRYPTILWIHGGPYGQDEYAFDFEPQLFAANGYVVVQVNYRGSSGRGVEFGQSIFADWGNKDVADVRAGIDHAIGLGLADPNRLGVGGWSQGGIMTNYAIAIDTRFKAAISGAGTANQLAVYGSDQYAFMYDQEFGAPWQNPELWIKLSYPFFHADRIRTPTFYLGGDKDFNVPIGGGEQMYQALKHLNVPTQLVVYPGEHHSFSRPSFDSDRLERYLAWFARYLKPAN